MNYDLQHPVEGMDCDVCGCTLYWKTHETSADGTREINYMVCVECGTYYELEEGDDDEGHK